MLVVGGFSLYHSLTTNEFAWFSRSGSIITVLGIMLTIKHNIFSESRDIKSVVKEKNHYANYSQCEKSDEYKVLEDRAKIIIRDEYLGAALTIVGTAIWGYGDLLVEFIT
jgi:hypothetical protein